MEFCHADIKKVYHGLFDEALKRYNAKQKRNDRKIDNYYEKIRQGKQEKLFHEAVFQIGNRDDMNAKSKEGALAKEILVEFMKDFQKQNPNLYVFSAHLHMDEETPHVHVDFVPVIRNSKRGLDTRVSLKGALGEQGFKGGARGATEWNQWIESEKQELSKVMERYGIKWKRLGTHNKHLSILDFEKQEREKEVAQLEEKCAEFRGELGQIQEQIVLAGAEMEQLQEDAKEAREEAMKAEKQADKQQKRLKELAPAVKNMEHLAAQFSSNPDEVLLDAGTIESGKSYREKKAIPVVEQITKVLRSIYSAYMNLTRRFERLESGYNRVCERKDRISERLENVLEENKELRSVGADFERVKRAFGADRVQMVIDIAKREEEVAEEQRRTARRKHNRDAGDSQRAAKALLVATMRNSGGQSREAKLFIYS